jgi:hypothetical protein
MSPEITMLKMFLVLGRGKENHYGVSAMDIFAAEPLPHLQLSVIASPYQAHAQMPIIHNSENLAPDVNNIG